MVVDLEDRLVGLRSEVYRDMTECRMGVKYSVD